MPNKGQFLSVDDDLGKTLENGILSVVNPSHHAANGNGPFITRGSAMREIVALLPKIAGCDLPVLMEGEFGVGKTTVAREIHRQSRRAAGPLLRIVCGGMRESELDNILFDEGECGTLFGDDECSQQKQHSGSLLARGRGGTLLLDDVPQLPFWAQVKLLDVLQRDAVPGPARSGVGPGSVRVIATSTSALDAVMAANRFYAPLYYFLAGVRIAIPPLRHRPEDVRAIGEHYLALAGGRRGTVPRGGDWRFSVEAWQGLMHYDWPGNIPQLASVVTRAVVLADAPEIGPACLADLLDARHEHPDAETISVPLAGGLKEIERAVIEVVIRRCQGNKAAAARTLGLHRRTLYRLLHEKDAVESGCEEMKAIATAATDEPRRRIRACRPLP